MTQREVLENLLQEIKHIKTNMPNGEVKIIQKDLQEMKEDMSEMKYTLLNPDTGVIVSTNKNTEFRQELQANEKEFREQMLRVTELERWKDTVSKALWVIFGILAAVIIRMLIMHSQ
jgi:hypothetical protein